MNNNNNHTDFINAFNDFKQTNPDSTLELSQLPHIQYELNQLKTGGSFGDINSDKLAHVRNGLSDNYLSSPSASLYYPQFKRGSVDYGTDMERYINDSPSLSSLKP